MLAQDEEQVQPNKHGCTKQKQHWYRTPHTLTQWDEPPKFMHKCIYFCLSDMCVCVWVHICLLAWHTVCVSVLCVCVVCVCVVCVCVCVCVHACMEGGEGLAEVNRVQANGCPYRHGGKLTLIMSVPLVRVFGSQFRNKNGLLGTRPFSVCPSLEPSQTTDTFNRRLLICCLMTAPWWSKNGKAIHY